MAIVRLRDRDAVVTKESIVFRVLGYSHPPTAFVCDVEYAPADVFQSKDPRALRTEGPAIYYKFYEDEGSKFLQSRFPKYMIFHEMLDSRVIGINETDIREVRKPEEVMRIRMKNPKDALVFAMQDMLDLICQTSSLTVTDFGVFGSLLHGFYHPSFSDIDLTVYGVEKLVRLSRVLEELYDEESSSLGNEFETKEAVEGKNWRFENYSPKEYLWHQRRKLIYALFKDPRTGRTIKTEFEPVKDWNEISNEYDSKARIFHRGWTRILARTIEDKESPFIPSTYKIEPLEVLDGSERAIEADRIVSYLEEFRMQSRKDDTVLVEGNLEEVATPERSFLQIALTYCPRYYEQVLKVKR